MSGPFNLLAIKSAVLSDDRRHRYWLVRVWTRSKPVLVVCMYNPSAADDKVDDPTIKRLCFFAARWGYGGILVVNLYSYRTSDPAYCRQLGKAAWGDAQASAWGSALHLAQENCSPVLVAWGNMATTEDAKPFFAAAEGLEFICLGTTKDGSPLHPMARGKARIPDDRQPVPYWPAA